MPSAAARSKVTWTQVETGSAITWKYPSCVLLGDDSVGEFHSVALTHHRQQADTGTKMIHIGKRTKSKIVSKASAPAEARTPTAAWCGWTATPMARATPPSAIRADRQAVRRAHLPYIEVKNPGATVEHEATTSKISDDQLFYCRARGISQEDAVSMIVDGFCSSSANCRWSSRWKPRSCWKSRWKVRWADRPPRPSQTHSLPAAAARPTEIPTMLKIENLHARIGDKEILKGLSLDVQPGQVHAIMGPNGAGKSTLGNVLAGREGYEVTEGSVQFDGVDLLEQDPEARAAAGLFLAFQYPVEIPGVNNTYFLRAALNAQRKARGEELDSMQFLKLVRQKLAVLHLKDELLHRGVNEGFSGGEKKRNEIFQLAVLEPKLAILDETDSGLDIDALKSVADGVNALRAADRSFLVITHYQRLLDYIKPDVVHVLADGRIVKTGGPELALELKRTAMIS